MGKWGSLFQPLLQRCFLFRHRDDPKSVYSESSFIRKNRIPRIKKVFILGGYHFLHNLYKGDRLLFGNTGIRLKVKLWVPLVVSWENYERWVLSEASKKDLEEDIIGELLERVKLTSDLLISSSYYCVVSRDHALVIEALI